MKILHRSKIPFQCFVFIINSILPKTFCAQKNNKEL